jgi:hypothetical protein
MAEPTPAPGGISASFSPSFSQSRQAWSGAPPPKATMVNCAISRPFSTVWTRAALAMFSSTISVMPKAASSSISPSVISAASARSGWSGMAPPAKFFGSSRPSARLASVTAGASPPRP